MNRVAINLFESSLGIGETDVQAINDKLSTNGICSLALETTACKVTEELNGSFELELEYPSYGKYFKEITLNRLIYVKSNPFSDRQLFRIYYISKPMPSNGKVQIKAQHISYDLAGWTVKKFAAAPLELGWTAAAALTALEENSVHGLSLPFTFTSNKQNRSPLFTGVEAPTSFRSMLGGTENSILDIFTGEYEFSNFEIHFDEHRGRHFGDDIVIVRYGKNLTDLTHEEDYSNFCTHVFPYYLAESSETNEDGDYTEVTNYITLEDLYQNGLVPTFPDESMPAFTKVLALDMTSEFDDVPTAEQLKTRVLDYINTQNYTIPETTLKVSFETLSKYKEYEGLDLLEDVYLGDEVKVLYKDLGIDQKLECVETVYDALTDSYESVTLGNLESNLGGEIARSDATLSSLKKEVTQLDGSRPTSIQVSSAIADATRAITGGNSESVVVLNSEDGVTKEILITDGREEPQSVWRFNSGGLGHSSHGLAGPYDTALTADGKIVGSMIAANSISAEQLTFTSGGINLVDNSCGWNSEFKMDGENSYVDIYGWTHPSSDGVNVTTSKISAEGYSWYTSYALNIDSGSLANSVLCLREGGTLHKTITVPGGKIYHCGCKARQGYSEGKTGTTKIVVNAIDYDDISVTMYESQLFPANAEKWYLCSETLDLSSATDVVLDISIETTGEAVFFVTDFIISEGSEARSWSPAPNELYTQNVRIDAGGVNISNSANKTRTKIDSEEFAVYSGDNKTLTVNQDETQLTNFRSSGNSILSSHLLVTSRESNGYTTVDFVFVD